MAWKVFVEILFLEGTQPSEPLLRRPQRAHKRHNLRSELTKKDKYVCFSNVETGNHARIERNLLVVVRKEGVLF